MHLVVGQLTVAEVTGKDIRGHVGPERLQDVVDHDTAVVGVLEQSQRFRDGSPKTTSSWQSSGQKRLSTRRTISCRSWHTIL